MEYKVARTGTDYRKAHGLMRAEGVRDGDLTFPTILAKQDGEVVGVLGTSIKKGMIVAGPLTLRSDRRRHFTLIRMVDIYDAVMRGIGIKAYVFHTDNPKFQELAEKLYGFKPYGGDGRNMFYIKRL